MNDRTPVSTSIVKLLNPLPVALSSNEYVTLKNPPLPSFATTVPIAVWFSAAVNVADDVNTGGFESTTLTVRVSVCVFPEASDDVYVSVYDPNVSVSTVPEVETVTVPDASEAVAPASVYASPNSAVAGLSPSKVITGDVVSTTLTTLEAVAVLLSRSVAVYVIV